MDAYAFIVLDLHAKLILKYVFKASSITSADVVGCLDSIFKERSVYALFCIIHSDNGSIFRSGDYVRFITQQKMLLSYTGTQVHGNQVVEREFNALKTQMSIILINDYGYFKTGKKKTGTHVNFTQASYMVLQDVFRQAVTNRLNSVHQADIMQKVSPHNVNEAFLYAMGKEKYFSNSEEPPKEVLNAKLLTPKAYVQEGHHEMRGSYLFDLLKKDPYVAHVIENSEITKRTLSQLNQNVWYLTNREATRNIDERAKAALKERRNKAKKKAS